VEDIDQRRDGRVLSRGEFGGDEGLATQCLLESPKDDNRVENTGLSASL